MQSMAIGEKEMHKLGDENADMNTGSNGKFSVQ